MKTLLGLCLALIACLAFASCGDDDETTAERAPATTTADARFPATVEHKFGTTTVPAEPKRIVIVGLTEQDTVLALGYKPIATTEWYGEQPYAVWPWAREALGDTKPTVLKVDDGFDFEKIAELRPDIIIGTNSGMKRSDYEKLSALAPTIAPPKGGTEYFSPWDQQTELVAAALGKPEEGRKLVADVKATYAQEAAKYPALKGKTVTFSQNGFYDGLLYVYQEGLNTEFLTYLGMVINPKITALAKTPGVQASVSSERLNVLDADVILFATEKSSDIPALQKVPTFNRLKAVQEHRAVFTDATLTGAIYFMTPLSLPYVAERLTPQLAKAVEGQAPRRIVDTSR